MTNPIALALTFSGNLETEFLKYLESILDIIFSKSHTLSTNFSEIIRKFSDDGS